MSAKVKNTSIIVSALVIGYLLGYICGNIFGFLPTTTGEFCKGDVSKVRMFHKKSVENSVSPFEQKLLNDTTALNKAVEVTQILSDKLLQFSELISLSVSVAGDIPELNKEVDAIKSASELSENATYAGKVATASFEKLKMGTDSELAIDVERASQNLALAYIFINHQAALGKDFVIEVDNYLSKNRRNEDLAMVRNLWAVFCAENAVITGDDAELAYWGNKRIISSNSDYLASKYQGIIKLSSIVSAFNSIAGAGTISDIITDLKGVGNQSGFGALNSEETIKGIFFSGWLFSSEEALGTLAPALHQYA